MINGPASRIGLGPALGHLRSLVTPPRVASIMVAAAVLAVAIWWKGVELGLIVATVYLGLATVWLGSASRNAIAQAEHFRAEDRRLASERHFRAALLEQLDECRLWKRWRPQYSDEFWARKTLAQHKPTFLRLRKLLELEDIDGQCRVRLLWRIDQLSQEAEEARQEWDTSEQGTGIHIAIQDWFTEWSLSMDRHQEVAGLVMGAALKAGLTSLVDSFDGDYMFEPVPGIKRVDNETAERTQAQLPPWPSDQAFARWSPAARDETAEKVQKALSDRMLQAQAQGLSLTYPDGPTSNPPRTCDL